MDPHEIMVHPLPSPEARVRAGRPRPDPPPFFMTRVPRCAHPHYKLVFGAKPVQFENGRFRCSNNECKKTRVKSSTKGCGDRKQAVEKHIMREHPDKFYKTFVCLKCGKKKKSPLQILEHLSTKRDKGGHGITGTEEKLECLRAELKGRQFR